MPASVTVKLPFSQKAISSFSEGPVCLIRASLGVFHMFSPINLTKQTRNQPIPKDPCMVYLPTLTINIHKSKPNEGIITWNPLGINKKFAE